MARVKEVISTLSSLIEHGGLPKVVPETFRAAKFNKPESETKLEEILIGLIEMESGVGQSDSRDVEFVAKHLNRLGYDRDSFYEAKESDEATRRRGESRELLLALAWLLARTKYVERLFRYIARACRALTTGFPDLSACARIETSLRDRSWFSSSSSEQKIAKKRDVPIARAAETAGNLLKQAVLMKNRAVNALRATEAQETLYLKLFHKARVCTSGRLSMTEIHLVRHPDVLKRCSDLIIHCNEILTQIGEWKRGETLFWQWMESVLNQENPDAQKTLEFKNHKHSDDVIVSSINPAVWTYSFDTGKGVPIREEIKRIEELLEKI